MPEQVIPVRVSEEPGHHRNVMPLRLIGWIREPVATDSRSHVSVWQKPTGSAGAAEHWCAAPRMAGPDPGSTPSIASEWPEKGLIMGLWGRASRPARPGRKPTRAERRAAERTAQAEARLEQTEQLIHDLANEVRADVKGSAH
jgi:hypothetical protein